MIARGGHRVILEHHRASAARPMRAVRERRTLAP
jgi:hypothetical protein